MAIARQPANNERWKLVVTLGVTFLIAYYDRLNISLAMPLIASEFGWSDAETASKGALLMSLFYAGYGIANILLSPLGARLGPRISLTIIILLWSLFTALGAVISQFLMLFMASRVLLGLSEGVHLPMMNMLTNRWFAPGERSRANSVWVSGLFLAILTAPIILVPIMHQYGWRTGFHILAVGGLLVSLPLVLRFVHDRPDTHPRLDSESRRRLEEHVGPVTSDTTPTWQLLRQGPFALLVLGGILNNMVALGIASWLPSYLATLDGVSYGDLSYLAALPYGASLAGLALWAYIGDRTNRRAVVAGSGYIMAGMLAVAAFSAGNAQLVWLTVLLLSLSVFCVSAYTASEFALVQKVVPGSRVAAGVGLYNGFTTMLGGGLGPLVVGGIIDGGAGTVDLIVIFSLCAAITVVLAFVSRRIAY